ncbi:hypothetical protein GH733_007141 [Mirounga leonina]|nr:hypothetical protein GH733_007141 [Mirounga leonina]
MLAECANVGHRERARQAALDGSHVKDGSSFATRLSKILIFGEDDKPWISLPKRRSNCPTIAQDRQRLLFRQSNGVRVLPKGSQREASGVHDINSYMVLDKDCRGIAVTTRHIGVLNGASRSSGQGPG